MFYGKSECFHASMKNFRLTNSRIGGKAEACRSAMSQIGNGKPALRRLTSWQPVICPQSAASESSFQFLKADFRSSVCLLSGAELPGLGEGQR
jgi:hypothetical protein